MVLFVVGRVSSDWRQHIAVSHGDSRWIMRGCPPTSYMIDIVSQIAEERIDLNMDGSEVQHVSR